MPLYFSRPLRRIDYFIGKLGVIAWFLAMVIILSSITAYVLGLLFSLDITIVRDTLPVLLGSIAYGLVIALSAGLLVLALSSLSRNSRYIALFWVGIWLLSISLSVILENVDRDQRRRESRNRLMALSLRREMPLASEDRSAWQRKLQIDHANALHEMEEAEVLAAKTNWRRPTSSC